MIIYYLFSIALLFSGGMILRFIHKNYPKSKFKNIAFGTVLILTIMSSLAIILEKFNICLILLGIIECIYTYKDNKKDCGRAFDPYLLEGYLVGYALILWGIGKGFSNGFFW